MHITLTGFLMVERKENESENDLLMEIHHTNVSKVRQFHLSYSHDERFSMLDRWQF